MFWLVSKRLNLKSRYTGDQRNAAYSPSAQMPGAFASSGDSEVSAVDLQRESQTSGRPWPASGVFRHWKILKDSERSGSWNLHTLLFKYVKILCGTIPILHLNCLLMRKSGSNSLSDPEKERLAGDFLSIFLKTQKTQKSSHFGSASQPSEDVTLLLQEIWKLEFAHDEVALPPWASVAGSPSVTVRSQNEHKQFSQWMQL